MVAMCLGEPGNQYADAWRCEYSTLAEFKSLGIFCLVHDILRTCYISGSGFTAVLSANIVIGLYILSAWKENDEKDVAPPVGRFAKAKEQ